MAGPLASVVVPNWNGAAWLPTCLESLRQQSYHPLEVVVVDGGSRDGSVELVRQRFPEVRLLALSHNRGFTGNVNAGLRAARGDTLLLLNNDATAEPHWVAACQQTLHNAPEVGSVAARMVYQDGTINSAGDQLLTSGRAAQRGAGERDGAAWDTPMRVFGASGGAAAYRRTMLADVGLLDDYYFAYLEDMDLAFRANLMGWTCLYQPAARVVHAGSATGGGPLASFLNGRNLWRLWLKNLPTSLLPELLPSILRYQLRRAGEALAAWRGAAARATLRGQVAGLRDAANHLAARGPIQVRRRVSDAAIRALLTPAR